MAQLLVNGRAEISDKASIRRLAAGPIGGNGIAPPDVTKPGWHVLAILSLLMGFASISTDLYLPALPAMATSLHASAGSVEFTISGYLIGFSLGQLFWGPFSDRYGRRLPIALGMLLFIIGAAGCALAPSVSAMIFWRVVQAVGACAGVVLARAMVRDLYAGPRAAQMLSTLMTVMAIAPLLGPILGAQILLVAGWRSIFWVLLGIGLLTLAALRLLPETLPAKRRNAEPLWRAFRSYGRLLKSRRLAGFAGACGLSYAGSFAYIAGSPSAYITDYQLPAQFYGLLFGTGIVGLMAANLINARLVRRLGGTRLLVAGSFAAALAGGLLAVDAWTGWGGVAGLALPVFLFVSASGFIAANAIAGALAIFPERVGTVAALVGSIQYGAGVIGSACVGALADGTPWPMGLVVGVCGFGGLLFTAMLRAAPRFSRR